MSDWYEDRDPYWRRGREWGYEGYDEERDMERGYPYSERRGMARDYGYDYDRDANRRERYDDDQDYGARWARGPHGYYRVRSDGERMDYGRGYGSYGRLFSGEEPDYERGTRFGGQYNRGRAGYGTGGFGSRWGTGYGYNTRLGGVEGPGRLDRYSRSSSPYGRSPGEQRFRDYGESYDFENDFDRDEEMDFDSDYEPGYWTYTEYWLIPGPYTGMGPQGYRRSDDRIREDVCERLTQHGQLDASDIEIRVEDGQVWLRGEVDSRQAKRMAEDTVETVDGVNEVHNELHLRKGMYARGQEETRAEPGQEMNRTPTLHMGSEGQAGADGDEI